MKKCKKVQLDLFAQLELKDWHNSVPSQTSVVIIRKEMTNARQLSLIPRYYEMPAKRSPLLTQQDLIVLDKIARGEQ